MKKRWRVASSSPFLLESLASAPKCDGQHFHEACRGRVARDSSFYTDKFASLVADGVENQLRYQGLPEVSLRFPFSAPASPVKRISE
ncbi:MAG: hypothetical protein AAF961_02985, partial [Planctomycetota bacterium]